MKIDVFAHVCPKKFIEYFSSHVVSWEKLAETDWPAGFPMLWDIDIRLEIMDMFEVLLFGLVKGSGGRGRKRF